MRVVDGIDRAIVWVNYRMGLWAIGTRFEPLMTTSRRVVPAVDSEITPASLDAMELSLGVVTRGTRVWALVGLLLMLAGPLSALSGSRLLGAVVFLVWPFAVLIWVVWFVVCMLRWRKAPEWGLGDSVALAIKQESLGDEAFGLLCALPPDTLLRVAFSPLLTARPSASEY